MPSNKIYQLSTIISGGQTGADLGALLGAKQVGFNTSGIAPHGWETESGPQEALMRSYYMHEASTKGYPARTKLNVLMSSATLIFGKPKSTGSKLTYKYCRQNNKPCLRIVWATGGNPLKHLGLLKSFLRHYSVLTLNVAGNRESVNRGIAVACATLISALPRSTE